MKNLIIGVIIAVFAVSAQNVQAQKSKKIAIVKFKTSAQCEECKERIEKAMAYEKGVVYSNLSVETKVLTVKYKVGKTTPDKIKVAVTKVGYDAGKLKAEKRAYDLLPTCCQKGGHPE